MRETLRAEMDLVGDDEGDPLALFDEFLRRLEARGRAARRLEDEELFEEVVPVLIEVAIEQRRRSRARASCGPPSTTSSTRRWRTERFDAAGLVLVAKILSDSGWIVPDA